FAEKNVSFVEFYISFISFFYLSTSKNTITMNNIKFGIFALFFGIILSACKNNSSSTDSATFEKELQEKLINAKDGDVIDLPEGTFTLTRSLILDGVNNVTIKGKGKDKTILNFKGQKDGAEGLRITANGTVLEDFAILNAKGDNIKVQDAQGITFRRIKSGWETEGSTLNGSYGVYPVGSTNVLIEDCEVFGSSDAGVYVGQSKNIIVRRNHVHGNVAGIEIENSMDADVYENTSEKNTGGILVFDLPGLSIKNGARCRVFNNKIIDNNIRNFGAKGTTVAEIPAGTGVILMATNQCEVFGNDIKGNNSITLAVVSYEAIQKPWKDSVYDPFIGGVSVHDNHVERGNGSLDVSVTFGQFFAAIFGDKVPDFVYDGSVNPAYRNNDGSIKEEQKICFRNNGSVTFANLDLANKSKNISSDISKMDCSLTALKEVKVVQ
ncbi:MAG TPA: parallel beta-helix domain-containing protein, partial [Chitinophagales bacterium]